MLLFKRKKNLFWFETEGFWVQVSLLWVFFPPWFWGLFYSWRISREVLKEQKHLTWRGHRKTPSQGATRSSLSFRMANKQWVKTPTGAPCGQKIFPTDKPGDPNPTWWFFAPQTLRPEAHKSIPKKRHQGLRRAPPNQDPVLLPPSFGQKMAEMEENIKEGSSKRGF